MEDNNEFYISISSTVLQDEKLSPTDKLTLGYICNLTHLKGYCWASNKSIAQKLNICEKTIQVTINKLANLNYIFKWKQKKGKIVYRVITTNENLIRSNKNLESLIQETRNIEVFDYDWLNDEE